MRLLPSASRSPWRVAFVFLFATCSLFFASSPAAAEPAGDAPCPACRGTGACQAKGCQEGKTPCPATCLKKDGPGWIKKKIEGYPDDYVWMAFRWRVGEESGTQYYSQHHAGELIEYENGKPVNRGRCPKCEGTSRVACATCKGDAKCGTCAGAGKFVRNVTLFTLSDAQGRAMEAVVRSRQGDTITVLRIADGKTFDIPLSKLSAESNELIDQKFPKHGR